LAGFSVMPHPNQPHSTPVEKVPKELARNNLNILIE